MTSPTLELEGTWEEILAHSAELAGHRVRVTVLPSPSDTDAGKPPLDPQNQRMLAALDELEQTPLTDEERAVLDGLEQFIRDHPFSLRQLQDP